MYLAFSLTGLLIPIALAVVLFVRTRQMFANDAAQLGAFAARLRLQGRVQDPLSLAGVYEGRSLYVTEEEERTGRGIRTFTRIRLLGGGAGDAGGAAGYREPHATTPAPARAFVVRRDEGFPLELATGLQETPTGSGTFDGVYRSFHAPGTASPWTDPGMQLSLVSMPARLLRVERGQSECAATFLGLTTNPAVLERAVVVVASLASPDGVRRHHAQLAAPLDASPSRADVRARWAGSRLAVVFVVGMIAFAPLGLLGATDDLVAAMACDDGDTVRMVSNGRGGTMRCIGKHGIGDTANGTWFLVNVDFAWAGVLVLFSAVELISRLRSRRSPRPASR